MLKIDKASIKSEKYETPYQKRGIVNFKNPKLPNFNSKLAKIIDPMVGASTCASGNHM
jgi:hypothetical protein